MAKSDQKKAEKSRDLMLKYRYNERKAPTRNQSRAWEDAAYWFEIAEGPYLDGNIAEGDRAFKKGEEAARRAVAVNDSADWSSRIDAASAAVDGLGKRMDAVESGRNDSDDVLAKIIRKWVRTALKGDVENVKSGMFMASSSEGVKKYKKMLDSSDGEIIRVYKSGELPNLATTEIAREYSRKKADAVEGGRIDAEFKEGDHPRGGDGKFGSGSGSSKSPTGSKEDFNKLSHMEKTKLLRKSSSAKALAKSEYSGHPEISRMTSKLENAKSVTIGGSADWRTVSWTTESGEKSSAHMDISTNDPLEVTGVRENLAQKLRASGIKVRMN